MATRLEEQQQACRIDIHEDMPHIFPLFRFHASASAALDRTSAYIRETVDKGRTLSEYRNEVIIPISSASSSLNSSAAQSPQMSSRQFESPGADADAGLEQFVDNTSPSNGIECIRDNTKRSANVDSVDSATLKLLSSSSCRTTTKSPMAHSRSDNKAIRTDRLSNPSESSSTRDATTRRAIVNVIDLSGCSAMSYHNQNRHQVCRDTSYMDVTQRRYHRPRPLTLEDVVSDATLYEWEILLKQGYIPTRHWPHPPCRRGLLE